MDDERARDAFGGDDGNADEAAEAADAIGAPISGKTACDYLKEMPPATADIPGIPPKGVVKAASAYIGGSQNSWVLEAIPPKSADLPYAYARACALAWNGLLEDMSGSWQAAFDEFDRIAATATGALAGDARQAGELAGKAEVAPPC